MPNVLICTLTYTFKEEFLNMASSGGIVREKRDRDDGEILRRLSRDPNALSDAIDNIPELIDITDSNGNGIVIIFSLRFFN
jgi:hypothetical protein